MIILANFGNPVVWGVLIVLLLLFGGTKIPEMMRGLGSGMREFKKGMNEEPDDELRRDQEEQKKRDAIEREVRARVEEEMRNQRQ